MEDIALFYPQENTKYHREKKRIANHKRTITNYV